MLLSVFSTYIWYTAMQNVISKVPWVQVHLKFYMDLEKQQCSIMYMIA